MTSGTAAFNSPILQRRYRISGIVQGVGFRPYVWHLARELGLTGWVRNDAAGVEVLVEGEKGLVEEFNHRLPRQTPPLAKLREIGWQDSPASHAFSTFEVIVSGAGRAATMIGHDSGVCPDCLAEMFDPDDRRWRYAFINCTHCGPRYTLTRKLPYDRALTSMADFPLCPDCEREYLDPANRRFHAEPTACPLCGPKLMLADTDGNRLEVADPLVETLRRLRTGDIVAIKGLGGFHLACDARNAEAVRRLRERKNRDEKPFAIMAANLPSIADWVEISAAEGTQLHNQERPIVLLRKKPGADAEFQAVAPGLAWLGVMLPYTPMHWLLFHAAAGQPAGTIWLRQRQDLLLVMTSANPGGEPLVIGNDEAVARLAGIADTLLMHDRDIVVRCDDSVVRCPPGSPPPGGGKSFLERPGERLEQIGETQIPQFIRRARGFTPRAIRLPRSGPPVLALGGYLKNTICVTRGDEAFLSQHIGGLDNAAACGMLVEVVEHLLAMLQVEPQAIAHDLHPDFFSTHHALELAVRFGVPAIPVQHHHAHIAAVAAEHASPDRMLGLALDGVGLGDDGTAWGGELLLVEGASHSRLGHLSHIPLPGGDKAAREPWRMAAAALFKLGRGDEIGQRFAAQPAAKQLLQLLERGINCPPSSSLGRWFDAAAGLLGVREVMAYEGQAAMLLEGLAAAREGQVAPMPGGFILHADGRLDLLPLLRRLAGETDVAFGAALFHTTLAHALAEWTEHAAQVRGINTVALGGGCFLNQVLASILTEQLERRGIAVLAARQAPPNDGGLSLGQAWITMQTLAHS